MLCSRESVFQAISNILPVITMFSGREDDLDLLLRAVVTDLPKNLAAKEENKICESSVLTLKDTVRSCEIYTLQRSCSTR